MTDRSAEKFACIVRALSQANMPIVVRESVSGNLVTVETKGRVHVCTVSRAIALQAGLLPKKQGNPK